MRIAIAFTGASGIVYGKRLIEFFLMKKGFTVDVIVSKAAFEVAKHECSESLEEFIERVRSKGVSVYMDDDFSSPLASSSSAPEAMIVVPCSMKTLASIANGLSDNLVSRAALSVLRLRRPLILVVRETPVGVVELYNMLSVAYAGGVILPASPGFYHSPSSISDLVDFIVGKILDVLGIEHQLYKKWGAP